MAKKFNLSLITLLQVCVAVFLIVLGLQGLIGKGGQDASALINAIKNITNVKADIILMVISVLEVVCGAIILAVLFAPVGAKFVDIIIIIAFVLWALIFIFKDVITAFDNFKNAGQILAWLKTLVIDATILLSIWIVRAKKSL